MTRRTKILATLGPATDTIERIEAIIAAGANTVRMNFSHGQAEDHIARPQKTWTNMLLSLGICKALKSGLPVSKKARLTWMLVHLLSSMRN